jgi:hypothetical protein
MRTIDNHFSREMMLLSTTTYCSALWRTARHYDVLLSTMTYCSALWRTARHYDVLLGTMLFIIIDVVSSFEFGPKFRWISWTGPKVIPKFYLGPKNHRKFGPGRKSGTKIPWAEILASRLIRTDPLINYAIIHHARYWFYHHHSSRMVLCKCLWSTQQCIWSNWKKSFSKTMNK